METLLSGFAILALFVIWFIVYDPETPVDLLQQDNPHQLVRECHSGKAQKLICPGNHSLIQPQGTSYDKN